MANHRGRVRHIDTHCAWLQPTPLCQPSGGNTKRGCQKTDLHYSRYSSPVIPIRVGSEPQQELFHVSSADEIEVVVCSISNAMLTSH